MDLSYGGEYERFRQEVRTFLETHGDEARGAGFRSDKSRAWQKTLIERGYTARTIPREYGGYGGEADILKSRIIAEEFAKAQVSQGLGGQGGRVNAAHEDGHAQGAVGIGELVGPLHLGGHRGKADDIRAEGRLVLGFQ